MNTSQVPDISGEIIIPRMVYQEIKSQQAGHLLEILQSRQRVSIVDPSPKFLDIAEEEAKKMGQNKLSNPDLQVLAVAIEYREHGEVRIYSDDYGVRNVAHQLNIESQGITTTGGNQKRRYKYQCKACGSYYKSVIDECDTCGHTKFSRYRA